MAVFEVEGPDGKVYDVDAPDAATAASAIKSMSGGAGRFAAPALANTKAEAKWTAGDVASDVAKGAGIGLAQGALGLATLPGNLEALGRAGINAGAGLLGIKEPVSPDTWLVNYNDAKGAVEEFTGDFYKPKTTAGKYAKSIGEFAPMAVGGPAGLAARAGRVAAPAIASEAAGQATEGTSLEPWARAGAAIAAMNAPRIAARAVTPLPADHARAGAIQTLEHEGVTSLTAGQRTGNKTTRWIEDATSTVPGGGGRATQMQTEAAEQFTRAALRRAGINAPRADQQTIDAAFTNIGREYQNFAAGLNLRPSQGVRTRLQQIAGQYEQMTPDGARIGAVRSIADDIGNRIATTGMTGQEYSRLRSEVGRMQRAARDNPSAAQALGRIVEMLDAHVVRSAPTRRQGQQLAAEIRDRNTRYRNLLAIEKAVTGAGEGAASGLISAPALRNAVASQNRRQYARGRHPMSDLARSGEAVLRPLPSSGTAERSFAQSVVEAPSTLPATIAGAVASGGNPIVTGAAALAPWATKAATARAIMSGPVQRYLSNQRVPQVPDAYPIESLYPLLPYIMSGPVTNG